MYGVSGKGNSRLRLDVLRPLQSEPEPRWTFSSGEVANRNRREIFERRRRCFFFPAARKRPPKSTAAKCCG